MAMHLVCCRTLARSHLTKVFSSTNTFERILPLTTTAKRSGETFFEKNERLGRPLSPHLTIYKLQLTSMLSVTHRATGMALAGGLYAFSIGMLILPANFPYYFEYLQSLHIGSAFIFSMKFALSWMVFYHTANGIRHLAWDMGYGYNLKHLYTSGYSVLGIATLSSLLAASV